MNLRGAATSGARPFSFPSFSFPAWSTWLLGGMLGLAAAAGPGCGSSETPHGAPVLQSVYWELIGSGLGAACLTPLHDAGAATTDGGDAGDALAFDDGLPKNQCLVWSKDLPADSRATVPPAAAQFNLVFDRVLDGAKIEDTITDGGITRQYPKLNSLGVNASPVMWELPADGGGPVPAFSLVVWYNSVPLPFAPAGSSYIYGRARSDDLPPDAPNSTLSFPAHDSVTLKLDHAGITSKYNEPMVGPETIVVDTAPFSLAVSVPAPPPGSTVSYAPINYWLPLEFNNRIHDPANHIQVVQNGRILRAEEYQLVTDPLVPTKLTVRPINVRTDPPAAGDRTTHPVWDTGARVEVTVAADLTDVYNTPLGVATTAVFIAGDAPDGGGPPTDGAGPPIDGAGPPDAGIPADAGDVDAPDAGASDVPVSD